MDLKRLFKKEPTQEDLETQRVISFLGTLEPNSEEYAAAVESLRTLQESRSFKNAYNVSNETKLIVIVSVLQFVAMMIWEQSHMLPKNALVSWFIKPKL